jgi:hypothetical protein
MLASSSSRLAAGRSSRPCAWWPVRAARGPVAAVRATAVTTADAAAAAVAARAADFRRYKSPLPPLGDKPSDLICVEPGVSWSIRQDFPGGGKSGINLNMAVFATKGGNVAYAPVAPTPEVVEMLRSVGGLAHLVVPNMSPEHGSLHAVGFAEAFPEATVWCVEGLLEGSGLAGAPGGVGEASKRLAAMPNARRLDRQALRDATGGDVDYALFQERMGLFREATLLVRPAKAAAFADLGFGAFNDEGMVIPPQRWMARLVGVYERLGSPVGFAVMSSDKAAARAWAGDIEAWARDGEAPEWVFGSHLTPAFGGAREELERGFAFVPLKF